MRKKYPFNKQKFSLLVFFVFFGGTPLYLPSWNFFAKMVNPGKNFFEKKILPYGRNRAGFMNVKYEDCSRHLCLTSNAPLRTKSFVWQLLRGFAPLKPHAGILCKKKAYRMTAGRIE